MTTAVEQPPPICPLRSSTVVLTPDAARTIAAESPFGPDPIIVAVDIPPAFYNPDENRVDELHLPARCVALDWVIIFSSSAVLISGYVLRVLLTSVGQSRDGGQ